MTGWSAIAYSKSPLPFRSDNMSRRSRQFDPVTLVGFLRYLDSIAEPTLADFNANPTSVRHGYLASVTAFHAIDRAPGGSKKHRQAWCKESIDFCIVDMVAHHFKHVVSDQGERIPLDVSKASH